MESKSTRLPPDHPNFWHGQFGRKEYLDLKLMTKFCIFYFVCSKQHLPTYAPCFPCCVPALVSATIIATSALYYFTLDRLRRIYKNFNISKYVLASLLASSPLACQCITMIKHSPNQPKWARWASFGGWQIPTCMVLWARWYLKSFLGRWMEVETGNVCC